MKNTNKRGVELIRDPSLNKYIASARAHFRRLDGDRFRDSSRLGCG